jgi:hypothetical protein
MKYGTFTYTDITDSYGGIRDYLVAKLSGVTPAIGKVQDYYRYLTRRKVIQAELFLDGVLKVWFVQKAGERDSWDGPGNLTRLHQINLIGFMAINDAEVSEKTFLRDLKNIVSCLQADYTFGGLAMLTQPPKVGKIGQQGFINTMCHNATISLAPLERISL